MAHRSRARYAAIDVEQVMEPAVGMDVGRQDAVVPVVASALFGGQDDGTGAVAEEDAGTAVLPIENARKGLRTDHQDLVGLPQTNEIVRQRQRVDEAEIGRASCRERVCQYG